MTSMSEIATTKDFQQRMFEKIRDQIGDLLTEEDLQKIVNASIQKAFFEPRTVVDNNSYSYRTKEVEPLFVELMRTELKPAIQRAADKWIKENPEVITNHLNDLLGKSFLQVTADYINAKAAPAVEQLRKQMCVQLGINEYDLPVAY